MFLGATFSFNGNETDWLQETQAKEASQCWMCSVFVNEMGLAAQRRNPLPTDGMHHARGNRLLLISIT